MSDESRGAQTAAGIEQYLSGRERGQVLRLRPIREARIVPAESPARLPLVAPRGSGFPPPPSAPAGPPTGATGPSLPGSRWHQAGAAAPLPLGFSRTLAGPGGTARAVQPPATWHGPGISCPPAPGLWIQRTPDARYTPARSRVRGLLDRLCGLDSRLPAPRTMVVVAHPDDEAIGVGARLAAVPDSMLVHVTDGAPRDPGYSHRRGFASREAYAESRQRELAAALALLGVSSERTRCLGIVDGEAANNLIDMTYRLVSLFDEYQPEIALTHPYEGGHTDHDSTAFAVHLACGVLRREGTAAPVVVELTSYHLHAGHKRVGEFLPFGDLEERTIELTEEEQALKQRVYDCFVSQTQCLSAFQRDRERFRAAPRYNFTRPPHAGPLLYERGGRGHSGRAWRAGASRALDRLRYRRRRFPVS